MSNFAKYALVIGAFLLSFGAVLAFAGVRWVGDQVETLREGAPEAMAEADAFGRGTTQEGCVDEGISRLQQCDGFRCQVGTVAFLQACLPASQESPGFCAQVPTPDQMMNTVRWAVEQCEARGAPNEECGRLIRRVQDFCYPDG